MPGDELLTVAEIAQLFKLNQQTGWNWIDRAELPCVVGRRVRIRWGTWRRSWNRLGRRSRACAPLDRLRRRERSGTRVDDAGRSVGFVRKEKPQKLRVGLRALT